MVMMLGWFSAEEAFGFMDKALLAGPVSHFRRGQDFEGDPAVQAAIASLVDDTHAAFAQFGDDFVVAQGPADH